MSYVVSPNVRNIGGRHVCQWIDMNTDGYVILDGYKADFSGVVGGEKVDIRVNSPIDPVTTITLSPGDNTLDAVVNRINSFIPGIATVSPFSDNSGVRIRHHTYLEVTDIYDRVNDFGKIGLPLAVRDGYAINDYKLVDGTATDQSGGGGSGIDRFDDLSLPIDIDPGANVVTIWSTVENIDVQCIVGIQLSVWWSNGFEGEIDNSTFAVVQLPADSQVFIKDPFSGNDKNTFIIPAIPIKRIYLFDMLPIPKSAFNPVTVPVPRGATKLRVGVATGNTTSESSLPFRSFIQLPKVTAAVYQGSE